MTVRPDSGLAAQRMVARGTDPMAARRMVARGTDPMAARRMVARRTGPLAARRMVARGTDPMAAQRMVARGTDPMAAQQEMAQIQALSATVRAGNGAQPGYRDPGPRPDASGRAAVNPQARRADGRDAPGHLDHV